MSTYYDIFGGVCSHLTFRTDSPKEHSSTSVKGEQLTNEEVEGNFLSICKAIEALEFCCPKGGSCVNIVANYEKIGWESGASQRTEDGPLIGLKGKNFYRELPISGKGNSSIKEEGTNSLSGKSVDLYSCGDIYGECVPVIRNEKTPDPIPYSAKPLPGFDSHRMTTSDSSDQIDLGFCLNMLGGWHEKIVIHRNGFVTFEDSMPGGQIMAFSMNTKESVIERGIECTYGKGNINGNPAFGVNWKNIPSPADWARERKTNSFQLVIIRKIDEQDGSFDALITFEEINWNTPDVEIGFNVFGNITDDSEEEGRFLFGATKINSEMKGSWETGNLSLSSSSKFSKFYQFEVQEQSDEEITFNLRSSSNNNVSPMLVLYEGETLDEAKRVYSSFSERTDPSFSTFSSSLAKGKYILEMTTEAILAEGDFIASIKGEHLSTTATSHNAYKLPVPEEKDGLTADGSFPLVKKPFVSSSSSGETADEKKPESLRISFCFEGFLSDKEGYGTSMMGPTYRSFDVEMNKELRLGNGLVHRYSPEKTSLGYWFFIKHSRSYIWMDNKVGRFRRHGPAELYNSYQYYLFSEDEESNNIRCPVAPEKYSITGEYHVIGGLPVGAIHRIVLLAFSATDSWVDFKRKIWGGPENSFYLKTQSHSVDLNSVAWGFQTCKYMPESCGPHTTTVDIGNEYKPRFLKNEQNESIRSLFDPNLHANYDDHLDSLSPSIAEHPLWSAIAGAYFMIFNVFFETLFWMIDSKNCGDAITKISNVIGEEMYPQMANWRKEIDWYKTIIKRGYGFDGWFFPSTLAWDWSVENGFIYQRTEIIPRFVTGYDKKGSYYEYEPQDQYATRGKVLFEPPEDYKEVFHGRLSEVGDQEAIDNGMIFNPPFKAVYPFTDDNEEFVLKEETQFSFGEGCSSFKSVGSDIFSEIRIKKNGTVLFVPENYGEFESEEDFPRFSPFRIDDSNEPLSGSVSYSKGKYYENQDCFRVDWNVEGNKFQLVMKEDPNGKITEVIFNYDEIVSTPSEIGIKTNDNEEWMTDYSNLTGDNDLGGRVIYFMDKHHSDDDDDDENDEEEELSDSLSIIEQQDRVIVPGFDDHTLPEGENSFTISDLGFSGEFFDGTTHSSVVIHRNGIVLLSGNNDSPIESSSSSSSSSLISFDDSILLSQDENSLVSCSEGNCPTDSFNNPLSISSLEDFGDGEQERTIVAPFFTSISGSSTVVYGQGEIDGLPAFGITWKNVQPAVGSSDESNTFQLLFIRESKEKGESEETINNEETPESSDFRLKTDIVRLEDSLDKLKQIQGVSYEWENDRQCSIGVIAQQIEPIFPELVLTDNKGYKSVNYTGLLVVALEAIKTLHKKINSLKDKMELPENK